MCLIGKKVTGATCGCDIDWRKITGKITYAYQNVDKTYVNVAWSEEIANRFNQVTTVE